MAVFTKPQLDRFLRQTNIIATLATLDVQGRPYLVPVWYEWDGTYLWIISKPRAEYVENLRKNPYAGVSIATQKLPYMRVFMQGRVRLIDTAKEWLPMGRRMAARYLGRADGYSYINKTRDWTRIYLRLKPARIVSWDGGVEGHDWGKRYIEMDVTKPTRLSAKRSVGPNASRGLQTAPQL